jgi:hypothetical protein
MDAIGMRCKSDMVAMVMRWLCDGYTHVYKSTLYTKINLSIT